MKTTTKTKLLLTAPQFECIADLIRARDPAKSAAYMVLVDGASNQDAMEATGISPASLSNTLTRYRKAAVSICQSFNIKAKTQTLTKDESQEVILLVAKMGNE